MQAGIWLSFNAALERFAPLYASLSNAVMRMVHTERLDSLVPLGSNFER